MTRSKIHSATPLTLVAGGPAPADDLLLAREIAPRAIAADSGADLCLRSGVIPEAVIGDLDSLSADVQRALPPGTLHHISEQDSTDAEKAMRFLEAPLVLGVGFLGARRDHELAALHMLMSRAHQKMILIGPDDVMCLCPPRITIALAPGTRLSLFPLSEVTATSTGLHWPIDHLTFAPGHRIGTSNRTTGDVTLTMNAAAMLLILPRACLAELVKALLAAAPWPVRDR